MADAGSPGVGTGLRAGNREGSLGPEHIVMASLLSLSKSSGFWSSPVKLRCCLTRHLTRES